VEHEVLIVGIGGQGIQLVGKTLAQAATDAGLHAMLAADYGGEMRGGPSQSTVVVGAAPLRALPILPEAGAAIVMHDKFTGPVPERVRPDGLVVLNSSIVDPAAVGTAHRVVALPVTDMAQDLGAPQGAGLIILGAFAAVTGVVDHEHMVAAMTSLLPPYRRQHAESNARALAAGAAAVTDTTARASELKGHIRPESSEAQGAVA
jgi:2-oxoglutarate ferredoxin oxidoreductase subunit gamma